MNAPPDSQLPTELDVADVKQLIDRQAEFLLLDCRRENEYEYCHIDGSTLIPLNALPARLAELEKYRNKPIVVYCHHGIRSLNVTHFLREQGFELSQSMAGGIDAWSEQIDPAVPKY